MSQSTKRKRTSNPVLSLLDLPANSLEQIIQSLPVESLESLRRSSVLLKNYVESTLDVNEKLYKEEIARPLKQFIEKVIQQNLRRSKNNTFKHIQTQCEQMLNDYPSFIHDEFRRLTNLKTSLDQALTYLNQNVNLLNRQDLTPRERATDQKLIANMGNIVTILQKINTRLSQLS